MVCKNCDTDLSLFDLDGDGTLDLDRVKVKSKEDIDAFLRALGDEHDTSFSEKLKEIASDAEFSSGEGAVVFECPACGAEVDAAADKCPSCGAEFASEVGCPNCGATVEAAATACAQCGARWAADTALPAADAKGPDLRGLLQAARAARGKAGETPLVTEPRLLKRELPKLVSEVKPMLLVTRELGLDLPDARDLINKAIAAGKARDMEQAVALVGQAKRSLHAAFTGAILKFIETPVQLLAKGEAFGPEAEMETLLRETISLLHDGDYLRAYQGAVAFAEKFPSVKPEPTADEAQTALQAAEALYRDSTALNIPGEGAEHLLEQAQAALIKGKLGEAARLAGKSRDSILRILPEYVTKQMRTAREQLLEAKSRGGNLTREVGLLKQASIHQKREEYDSALRYLRLFSEEIRKR